MYLNLCQRRMSMKPNTIFNHKLSTCPASNGDSCKEDGRNPHRIGVMTFRSKGASALFFFLLSKTKTRNFSKQNPILLASKEWKRKEERRGETRPGTCS